MGKQLRWSFHYREQVSGVTALRCTFWGCGRAVAGSPFDLPGGLRSPRAGFQTKATAVAKRLSDGPSAVGGRRILERICRREPVTRSTLHEYETPRHSIKLLMIC
jgi:hypothetical protein